MIRSFLSAVVVSAAIIFAGSHASAKLHPGDTAPIFDAETADGRLVSLSEYIGKTVVLEWVNYDCPFVRKHYDSENMQGLQETYGKSNEDIVWLSVFSSAPGKQGYMKMAELERVSAEKGNRADALLRDPTGTIGKMYGAKTTPHMYVINPEGKIAYIGAIDSKPGTDPSEIDDAQNYVTAALGAVAAGNTPDPEQTTPYGCSVKYSTGY